MGEVEMVPIGIRPAGVSGVVAEASREIELRRKQKKICELQAQLEQMKGSVSPVSSVYLLSALCLCCTFSVLLAQVVQSVEKHTLGTRFCHIMFLFGL